MQVHAECPVSQMNIGLLPFNEDRENFESTSWRYNRFQGPKKEGK